MSQAALSLTTPHNNPYPSRRQARIEYAGGDLVDAQAADVAAFHKIINAARVAIAALTFPLGSPTQSLDLNDIEAALTDLLDTRPLDDLEAVALEIATDADDPAADEADLRRDTALEEAGAGDGR